MLNWLRGPGTSKAAQPAWVPEMVDRVSRHVEDQVFAITGQRGALLPSHSSMTDLLIGAYIVGALEGYARTIPEIQNTAERGNTRELHQGAATEVCSRVFGPQSTSTMGWSAGISPHLPAGAFQHVLSWCP